jgi:hypothetical protein
VATKAMAAKLARLTYRMPRYGMKYVNQGAEFYEAQHRKQQIIHLKRKAAQLGLEIIKPRLGVSEGEFLVEFLEREDSGLLSFICRRSRYKCNPVFERGELMPLLHEGSVETLRDHKSTRQSFLPYECGTMSHPLPSCFPLRLDSAPARCFHI